MAKGEVKVHLPKVHCKRYTHEEFVTSPGVGQSQSLTHRHIDCIIPGEPLATSPWVGQSQSLTHRPMHCIIPWEPLVTYWPIRWDFSPSGITVITTPLVVSLLSIHFAVGQPLLPNGNVLVVSLCTVHSVKYTHGTPSDVIRGLGRVYPLDA